MTSVKSRTDGACHRKRVRRSVLDSFTRHHTAAAGASSFNGHAFGCAEMFQSKATEYHHCRLVQSCIKGTQGLAQRSWLRRPMLYLHIRDARMGSKLGHDAGVHERDFVSYGTYCTQPLGLLLGGIRQTAWMDGCIWLARRDLSR